MKKPFIINYNINGNLEIGKLVAVQEENEISFNLKRIYWTYDIPNNTKRGFHAHKKTEQILVCLKGKIIVETITPFNELETFELSKPDYGLYLPPNSWHTMTYVDNAIQLVLASELYEPNDYIRDFNEFIKNKY